jgi:hypothetical protein
MKAMKGEAPRDKEEDHEEIALPPLHESKSRLVSHDEKEQVESIGMDVMSELGNQREVIKKSKKSASKADKDLSRPPSHESDKRKKVKVDHHAENSEKKKEKETDTPNRRNRHRHDESSAPVFFQQGGGGRSGGGGDGGGGGKQSEPKGLRKSKESSNASGEHEEEMSIPLSRLSKPSGISP